MRSVSEQLEKKVRDIYNDCWKAYKEYLGGHDMSRFNERVAELTEKYDRDRFLVDILWAFAPVVNELHAEFLMAKEID